MIRKASIGICLTMVVGIGALWLASWLSWMSAGWRLTDRSWISYWVADGHFQASCFVAANLQDIESIHESESRRRAAFRSARGPLSSRIRMTELLDFNFFRSYWFNWKEPSAKWVNVDKSQNQTVLTSKHSTQIGFSLWLPFALFLIHPAVVFIRGPVRRYRRRKRNQCISCGYCLFGLTCNRCPECGVETSTMSAVSENIPENSDL